MIVPAGRRVFLLQPHDLFHNAVAHVHGPYQHQQVEHQLPDIAPHSGDGGHVRIYRRRRGCHNGENGAGQGDDGTFQTHPGVGAEKVFPHMAGGLPGKGGERDGRDGRVHVELEQPGVDGQNHHKGQHDDDQPAQQGDCPQGDGLPEAHFLDFLHDFRGEGDAAGIRHPGLGEDGAHHPLDDGEQGQHQFQPIPHGGLGENESDKQLQGGFRAAGLGEAAAGAHHSYGEEQHQQPVANGLQRHMDVHHHVPDAAAPEGGRVLGEQLPDLRQLVVPGVQGVVQIVNDPVGGKSPPFHRAILKPHQ